MTEADWRTGTDYAAMAQFAAECAPYIRRRRLLAVAFCRALGPLVSHPQLIAALDVIERSADDDTSWGELDGARQSCRELALASYESYVTSGDHRPHVLSEVAWAVAFAATNPVPAADVGKRAAAAAVEARTGAVVLVPVATAEFDAATAEQAARMSAVVREVFGDLFRAIDFSPWRTDTAVSLARTMYEAREFGAMPILADALQDAGCDDEEVLNHCREPGEHVRGCWVVDAVLGRE